MQHAHMSYKLGPSRIKHSKFGRWQRPHDRCWEVSFENAGPIHTMSAATHKHTNTGNLSLLAQHTSGRDRNAHHLLVVGSSICRRYALRPDHRWNVGAGGMPRAALATPQSASDSCSCVTCCDAVASSECDQVVANMWPTTTLACFFCNIRKIAYTNRVGIIK